MIRVPDPTPPRALLVAAALVAVSLGIVWHATSDTYGRVHPGYTTTTLTHNWYTGGLDLTPVYLPGSYTEGDPTDGARGFEAPVRIVLAPAIAILVWAAVSPTRTARRVAGLIVYGLVGCALIAVSDRYVVPAVICGAAAVLTRWALSHPGRSVPAASGPGPSSPVTSF